MSRLVRTVNQPDRVSWNSNSDTNRSTDGAGSKFQVQLNTPLLEVEEIQLLRASVPQAGSPIPQYQLVFWYYELPTATTVPTDEFLFCIRFTPFGTVARLPDYANVSAFYPTTPITSLTGGLTELVALLNTASSTGDTTSLNGYWKANAITWALVNGVPAFKGNNSGFFYTPAGWNDPLVIAAQTYSGIGGDVSPFNKFYPFYLYPATNNLRNVFKPNPYKKGFTLNQRLGYALSGTSAGPYYNAFQPFGNFAYANQYNITFPNGTNIIAGTQPNIGGSSIVSIYGAFSGYGGSSTSGNRLNLLGVIPLTQISGYNNFTGVGLKAPLYKVINDIYAMDIELRDENDEPYLVPDSFNVNLEIGFKYRNVNKPQLQLPM
jgi:hypothetical protein